MILLDTVLFKNSAFRRVDPVNMTLHVLNVTYILSYCVGLEAYA